MGLNMPEGESSDNKSGIDMDRAEKTHGKFPKEAFGKSVHEEAGKELSPSGREKRVTKHKVSREMKHAMSRGLVSEAAAKKAMGKGSTPKRAEHHGNRDQSQSKETGSRTVHHEAKVHGNR
jgi:hypothetical protein